MKLKHILLPCAGALLLSACEKDHRNDNLTAPRVYIVNNGMQTATYYDVEQTSDFKIYAYGSGYDGRTTRVTIVPAPEIVEAYNTENGTSFAALPEDCYRITEGSGTITAEGRRTTLSVRLDCEKIMQQPYMNDFLLPLRLRSTETEVNEELGTILINPRVQQTEIRVRNAGFVESDLSNADASSLEFSIYTDFDNKWDTQTEYEYGEEVLAEYNADHGTAYIPLPKNAYVFTPAQLLSGCNEAVSTIEIDKSGLTPDRYYTLAVRVKSNSLFHTNENNTVVYHISLSPICSDNRSTWKFVSCSSWMSGLEASKRGLPQYMIDGDMSSRWESRYNAGGEGDINPAEASTVFDMGKTFYYCGTTIIRRGDSYVTDLRGGYIALSDDGENWTKVHDFDFGDKTNKSRTGTWSCEQWLSGRYVKVATNKSNRNILYEITEYAPTLAEKVR